MKIRSKNEDEIKIDMTPMIDIVFQLLVFFIMTFKIVPMEGDFNIRMPLKSDTPVQMDEVTADIITVILKSDANGVLSAIEADNEIDGKSFTGEDAFKDLTDFVESSIAGDGDPSTAAETEVEFDIDYNLKYKHTVKAIESVSGRINADGTIKKLIEKIKFKDNSGG